MIRSWTRALANIFSRSRSRKSSLKPRWNYRRLFSGPSSHSGRRCNAGKVFHREVFVGFSFSSFSCRITKTARSRLKVAPKFAF